MLITTKINTIFIMVGPTECGKSTFAHSILVPQLSKEVPEKNLRMNVQVISSDEIRRDLLGYDYQKHDTIMMEASGQAFDLLTKKLEAVISFPINAEFVIVDTKGFSDAFRKQIIEMAKRYQYHVELIIFDYKDIQDYYLPENKSRNLIANDVRRLRTDVLPSLRRSDYEAIHRVRAKDFLNQESANYEVTIKNMSLYLSTILPVDQEYMIIGDVHEEVSALQALLIEKGFVIEENIVKRTEKTERVTPILVGDFIDKGGKTAEVIRFLYLNRNLFRFVKGNHENFVHKYLLGKINKSNLQEELIEHWFTSIQVLQEDASLRQLFEELMDLSVPFYRYIGVWKNSFYITHAPCENKYLGKLDDVSEQKQRNFSLNRELDIETQLSFLKKESTSNHPYHVFGHVPALRGIRLKNKIGLDLGAVHGNALMSVSIGYGKLFFKQVPTKGTKPEELPILFDRKRQTVSLADLEDDDIRRMRYIGYNQINFISGTISPSDKDMETGELESLERGLHYFQANGVKRLVMEPKYMGSRCTVYLGTTADESFAVSRNGYKIKKLDLSPVYEALLNKHRVMMETKHIKMLEIDGELMPWMALGKDLIEREFKVLDVALEQEIQFLKDNGFETQLMTLREAFEASEFAKDQSQLSKKNLIEKYGNAIYSNFKHVRPVIAHYVPLAEHEIAYRRYHEQVELYGSPMDIHFKPFHLLKIVFEDNTEQIPSLSTSENFALVSDDDFLIVDFDDPNYLEKANDFYQTLTTDRKMEGVVLKPDVPKRGVANAMKVRNPEYLHLIYGYDYTFSHKYESLLKQKNIAHKLATSIREYELGMEMLEFPIHTIDVNNTEYQQVIANMLFETNKEASIDPRL